MKLPTHASLVLLTALASFAGCNSPSTSLRKMDESQRADMYAKPSSADDVLNVEARTRQRIEKVRKLLADGEVKSKEDHLHAGLILVQSNKEEDFIEAQAQGLKAAEMGDDRGFRVAADAQDKLLLKRGLAQRYGTQFVWEPVLRAWRLYATDPRTTDAERKAMGVPPMAEILQQEKALNAKPKNDGSGH